MGWQKTEATNYDFITILVSGTEGRETVCVTLQEFTVPCNVRGDNW